MHTPENILRKHGLKVTAPRKLLLDFLIKRSEGSPLSIGEIVELLAKQESQIDMASIYRTLRLLKESGVVQEVDFEEGMKRYEYVGEEAHHHHLVCKKCGKVVDIDIEEAKIFKKIENKTHFIIDRHLLEFFGFCPSCQ